MEDTAKGGTSLAGLDRGRHMCVRVSPAGGPGGDIQGRLRIVSDRAQELGLPQGTRHSWEPLSQGWERGLRGGRVMEPG